MTVPSRIRLRLLGRFSITADGPPSFQLKISSKKGTALLAYLALHPEHLVGRERLATLLWGDRRDQQARLNLRQCLLSLRKTLAPVSEDWIILDGDDVGLRMDRFAIDALEFRKLARSTGAGDLERAAALYCGPFVDELEIDTEEYAAWLDATRAQFATDAARVLELCADQREAADHAGEAIDAAERLVALDPLREDWQRRLIRLIARHRGSDAALSHARGFVASLKKELDVAPEPKTLALIEQIRRGEIAPLKSDPLASALKATLETARPDDDEGEVAPSIAVLASNLPVLEENAASPAVPQLQSRPRASAGTLWLALPLLGLLASLAVFLGAHRAGLRLAAAPDEITVLTNSFADLSAVAVLPFEAADQQATALADLVSDDVIDQLSHAPNLRVISRLTSHQNAQAGQDIAEIGTRLNVRYAVHGSIRSEEQKWRVSVELIDVASRLQIWSDQFDEAATDQPDAAQAIADQLGRSLQVAVINFQAGHGDSLPPGKSGVDALVAAGWQALLSNGNAETLAIADTRFSKALQFAPNRVGAMLGLAAQRTLAVAMILAPEPQRYLAEAEGLLSRVLKQRPDWSPAYYYHGLAQLGLDDQGAALIAFEKSVSLNSSFAPAYLMIGRVLTMQGKYEQARQDIQHARDLGPKDPLAAACGVATGLVDLEQGRNADAIELISRGVIANPGNPFSQIALAAAYSEAGDTANAEFHVDKFKELTANLTDEQRLSYFAITGDHAPTHFVAAARRVLARTRQANSK